ncbi:unnamed protein product [Trichogramma brassicae]|uniref:Uncharacterized protein n=1 Tax=Trichogramma brassicae TaxID=86971 RepID=A0A6H5I7E6_9HYME|nr:unnamed protein product [Trichogramma brassicae]
MGRVGEVAVATARVFALGHALGPTWPTRLQTLSMCTTRTKDSPYLIVQSRLLGENDADTAFRKTNWIGSSFIVTSRRDKKANVEATSRGYIQASVEPTHVFVNVINLTQRASKKFQQSRRIASKSYSVNEYTVLSTTKKKEMKNEHRLQQRQHRCRMSIHAHLDVNACRVYHSTECTRERRRKRDVEKYVVWLCKHIVLPKRARGAQARQQNRAGDGAIQKKIKFIGNDSGECKSSKNACRHLLQLNDDIFYSSACVWNRSSKRSYAVSTGNRRACNMLARVAALASSQRHMWRVKFEFSSQKPAVSPPFTPWHAVYTENRRRISAVTSIGSGAAGFISSGGLLARTKRATSARLCVPYNGVCGAGRFAKPWKRGRREEMRYCCARAFRRYGPVEVSEESMHTRARILRHKRAAVARPRKNRAEVRKTGGDASLAGQQKEKKTADARLRTCVVAFCEHFDRHIRKHRRARVPLGPGQRNEMTNDRNGCHGACIHAQRPEINHFVGPTDCVYATYGLFPIDNDLKKQQQQYLYVTEEEQLHGLGIIVE